jgi:tetratricopeptide (TPR) repeat protein
MNRGDEALKEIKLAQTLNPLNIISYVDAIGIYRVLGRYDDSFDEFTKGKAIDPNYDFLYLELGYLYHKQGKYKEAIELFNNRYEISELPHKKALFYYITGIFYAYSGESGKAEGIFEELLKEKETIPGLSSYIASYYIAFEEYDKAFEWLDRAYEERDPGLIWIKTESLFDPLRSDPRFQTLIKKMGFPEEKNVRK